MTHLVTLVLALALSSAASLGGCFGAKGATTDRETKQMTESPSAHIHHAIDYIELTVTSLAEAKRFYGEAFGWAFTDYGDSYAGIRVADREVGGIRQDAVVHPGGPLVILYSRDLEKTLQGVRQAGGKITKEPFAFPGGRRFHFDDPSGNALAVWSPQ